MIEDLQTKYPYCSEPLILRNGKYGQFWECSEYPNAMLEPDHHKWTEYVGDRVRKSKDVVWGILVEEWCKQCLGQDASNYFIEMVRNALI